MRMPVVSGRDALKALVRLGFQPTRPRGSHVRMKHPDGRSTTLVLHAEIKAGTLQGMLEKAGVSRAEFLDALR